MPFHENQSRSNINQVMRSHSAPNPASTISNVKSRKSGSISINQTSSTAAVNESGTGRFSISRSEGYSEYSSTMRIEERESPNNTEVPSTKHSMLLQLIYTLLDILGAYVKGVLNSNDNDNNNNNSRGKSKSVDRAEALLKEIGDSKTEGRTGEECQSATSCAEDFEWVWSCEEGGELEEGDQEVCGVTIEVNRKRNRLRVFQEMTAALKEEAAF